MIVLWSWVGRSRFLLLMCLACHFYRPSKQYLSVQWCLLLLLVLRESAGLEHHWSWCLELPTAWSVWLQSGLTVLCSTGTTWASPLVVIPVLCGNRTHPSNQDSLDLVGKNWALENDVCFFLSLCPDSLLQHLGQYSMGVESKRWEWMAERKKIQGEAELSSFTNSACGVVLGTCLSFTRQDTPCWVSLVLWWLW